MVASNDIMEGMPKNPEPHSIPAELIDQLGAANQRFKAAREHVEQAMDDVEYRHQERIDDKKEELNTAEREVEEITKKIDEQLPPPK